ncbi:hypothetical protein [Serratia sp. CY83965]|uniref:hypothetical protein n=1 Tax=Serratia sp. CY83965 TaxID=3383693 RepID=UPI003FA09C65
MSSKAKKIDNTEQDDSKNNVCGIIMPIADTPTYPKGHWTDVYNILSEAASSAGFEPNMVSFDDDVSVIQKRIVQNIYNNPIVVCDISARNANVMFELGMRLAFDKPTVIVKDEKTPYSFDISSIEHLEYPSDLRYQAINDFKEKLAGKIQETHKRATTDPEYTTFLKHFGTFKVAKLDEKEVGVNEIFLEELKEIKRVLNSAIKNDNNIGYVKNNSSLGSIISEREFKPTTKYFYQFREPNLGNRFDEFVNIIERFDRAHAMGFIGADKINGDSATVFYNRPQNKKLLENMRMEVAQYFA